MPAPVITLWRFCAGPNCHSLWLLLQQQSFLTLLLASAPVLSLRTAVKDLLCPRRHVGKVWITIRIGKINVTRVTVNCVYSRVKWNELGFLSKKFHKSQLTQTVTQLPKIYGLPKIHKNNIPLRPIVSCVGSPSYHLSKTLEVFLRNSLRKPNSYVKTVKI